MAEKKLFSFSEKGAKLRVVLISVVVLYIGVLVVAPLSALVRAVLLSDVGSLGKVLLQPDVFYAFGLTLALALAAVVLNTFFGLIVAWVMVRHHFPGKKFLNGLIDLPFAVSPVVVGYVLFLLFGRDGWFGSLDNWIGIPILFSWPSMLAATVFVSLPFVIREVMPVLQEIGTDQDQASYTLGANQWQTFWRVLLPSIRWGLLYGMTLTFARSLGEFGAVFVVSGAITQQTETATLFIYRSVEEREYLAGYSVALILAGLSFCILFLIEYLKKKEEKRLTHGH